MNRRAFFRRASLIAAGVVAADQLEILERLTWRRRYFPGAEFGETASGILARIVSLTSDSCNMSLGVIGHYDPRYQGVLNFNATVHGFRVGDLVRIYDPLFSGVT